MKNLKKILLAATLTVTAAASLALASNTRPVDTLDDCIFVLKSCTSYDFETGKTITGKTTCFECGGVIKSCEPCGSWGKGSAR